MAGLNQRRYRRTRGQRHPRQSPRAARHRRALRPRSRKLPLRWCVESSRACRVGMRRRYTARRCDLQQRLSHIPCDRKDHRLRGSIAIRTCSIAGFQSPHVSVGAQVLCSSSGRRTPYVQQILQHSGCCSGTWPGSVTRRAISSQRANSRNASSAAIMDGKPVGIGSRASIALAKNRAHMGKGKKFPSPIRRPQRQLTPLTCWASVSGKRLLTQYASGLAKACFVQPTHALLTSLPLGCSSHVRNRADSRTDPCRFIGTSHGQTLRTACAIAGSTRAIPKRKKVSFWCTDVCCWCSKRKEETPQVWIFVRFLYCMCCVSEGLCRRGDLNPHALLGTTPSRWRVYQFHHFGMQNIERYSLAATPGHCQWLSRLRTPSYGAGFGGSTGCAGASCVGAGVVSEAGALLGAGGAAGSGSGIGAGAVSVTGGSALSL